jgi:hypothetical protein
MKTEKENSEIKDISEAVGQKIISVDFEKDGCNNCWIFNLKNGKSIKFYAEDYEGDVIIE